MLPSLVPTLQETIDNMNSTTTTATMGKTFKFDFSAGDFVLKDGKVVELEDLEGLKMWIEKAIRDIGLDDLVVQNFHIDFTQSEIIREITEVLAENTEINNVTDFAFTTVDSGLNVAFTVDSIYGTTGSEVVI